MLPARSYNSLLLLLLLKLPYTDNSVITAEQITALDRVGSMR